MTFISFRYKLQGINSFFKGLNVNISEHTDTITAIATPKGDGGLGVIRISGDKSLFIAEKIFKSEKNIQKFKPYTLHYGYIFDDKKTLLDDILLAYMPKENSVTGEDIIELHCHGGQALLTSILEEVIKLGARLAKKGEFTLRAFLNDKIDLTQAEAVAEIIHAPSKEAAQLAQIKRSGVLGQKIQTLRALLENLRIQMCIAVDFPEEELECLSTEELLTTTQNVYDEIQKLLIGIERTKAWREGTLCVLLGRVNAGKSSLLNALLGKERAIVTDIAGTTRDYLEETLNLDGLLVRITDTAGLRDTTDIVEKTGIGHAKELASEADLVLFLLDNTEEIHKDIIGTLDSLDPKKTLIVLNKSDLSSKHKHKEFFEKKSFQTIEIAAKFGDNIDALSKKIQEILLKEHKMPDPDTSVPNLRQATVLKKAQEELEMLIIDAKMSIPYDLLGVRLETVCTLFAEITGEISSEDILNAIFDSFCIGK